MRLPAVPGRPRNPRVQGCQGIDGEMLRGGMRGGQVVEVCGESGEPSMALPGRARQGWVGPCVSGSVPHGARGWVHAMLCPVLPCTAAAIVPLRLPINGVRLLEAGRELSRHWHARLRRVPAPLAASGKTQLCLGAAVQAARLGKRVVFVDTSNSLRGARLRQVAQAQAAAAGAAEVGVGHHLGLCARSGGSASPCWARPPWSPPAVCLVASAQGRAALPCCRASLPGTR